MATVCCVPKCPRNKLQPSDQPSSGYFHRFTDDPKHITEWCHLLCLPVPAQNQPSRSSTFVCDRHFSLDQYASRSRLRANAVPDCHLPNEPRKEDDKRVFVNCDSPTEEASSRNENCNFSPPLIVSNLNKMCRLCLAADEDDTFESIFEKENLVDHIQQAIGLEIQQNDSYPNKICQTCIERINYIYRSREWFHKNDQFLQLLSEQLTLDENSNSRRDISPLIIPDQQLELRETNVEPLSTMLIKEELQLTVENITMQTVSRIGARRPDNDKSSAGVTAAGCSRDTAAKRRRSQKQSRYFCNKCYHEFDTQAGLDRHASRHRNYFPCQKCREIYPTPKELRLHMEKYHNFSHKRLLESDLIKEMAEAFNGTCKQA